MATSPFTQSETTPPHHGSHATGGKMFPVSSPPLYHQAQVRRTVETYQFNQAYLERLAAADDATTEHFVRYFYKILLVKFRAKMRSSNQAEDIAQESLYRVLRYVKKHGGIDSPEKLGGFVNSVSEKVLLENIRQGGRFQQVPENTSEPVERALDAERIVISKEQKAIVRRELRKLKKNDQTLLEKVFLLEQDKDAICADLRIDRNYLRVQIHRALGRFRKVLEQGRL